MGTVIKHENLSPLPASIGLSIDGKKCHYLVWVPSESGPLIIDYGDFKNQNYSIPFDYLINKVKGYDDNPRISLSLDNQYVKYDFFKSYKNSNIDIWNKNMFYDKKFHKSYDSYLYPNKMNMFSIHILKTIKQGIVSKANNYGCNLINIGVGIFSALDGVKAWQKVEGLDKYIIIKFSKRSEMELLFVEEDDFSSYMVLKKKDSNFKIVNFFGDQDKVDKSLKVIKCVFEEDLSEIDYKIFYYSIDGNRDDIDFITNIDSKDIELINPFKNLTFDDSCKKKINDINCSAYSELGSLFRGVDV